MDKSTWKSLAFIWECLCCITSRRRKAALRQRNMLAGVVAVLLLDLLLCVCGVLP